MAPLQAFVKVAYLVYFTVLYGASIAWTYSQDTLAVALALSVVCAHFALGALSLWKEPQSIADAVKERYLKRPLNAIADTTLTASLVLLAIFAADTLGPKTTLYSGCFLAVVGNSFCLGERIFEPTIIIAERTPRSETFYAF